jgi:hypothetical protein
LEGGNGCDFGTWKSNHKGPNVDANEWLFCDKDEAFENASAKERTSRSSCQHANQKHLFSKECAANSRRR